MRNSVYNKLKRLVERGYVKKNFDLTNFNSYRLKSKCKIAVLVNSIETFLKTMVVCSENNLKPIILGSGSNVILGPIIDGVVVILGDKFSRVYNKGNRIIAESGALLSSCIKCAKEHGLTGLEDAIGIPASVGGAVYMNASAFSFEMSKCISSVLLYSNGKIEERKVEDMEFSYRHSSLQESGDIVLRVEFKLKKGKIKEIEERIKQTLAKRVSKQKSFYPNAGSVFKNGNNYFAGELIDKCGLKNYNIGNAYVSNFHANFIENRGGATMSDVLALINHIKATVFENFGVELELEQQVIGEKT